jgi:short-subunit dehydrogenase involved in D-alanine esterification of teichoic acids
MSGNPVLITGGVTGIGLALAEALIAKGKTVAIFGRRRVMPQPFGPV